VHAYNTGRTTRQRELGETPLEKAADFELADSAVVLDKLYPTAVKTAAQLQQDSVVSFEYAIPPSGMLERRAAQLRKEAAAKVVIPPMEKAAEYVPLEHDPESMFKKAYNRTKANTAKLEESRREVTMSYHKAAGHLDALRDYFREPDHMMYGDVVADVRHRLGPPGNLVMQKLAAMEPRLLKEAATKQVHMGASPAVKLAEATLQELHRYNELKSAHDKLAAELAADSEAVMRPFVQRPSTCILTGNRFSEKTSNVSNAFTWGLTGAAAKDALGGIAHTMMPPKEKLLQRSLSELSDPQHEANLRNIRTQAMLQDLMSNDPVISGYQPDEVLGAFNELGEVSPRAVDQRLIMQPMLRKRLQQGVLDPFEVDQLLGMEGKLKTRDQVTDDAPSESIL
jgi:hypothetical protein